MDWHGNRLSGQLPDMLLPNQVMQFVALYDNAFTGTLPDSWGTHLKNVFHLDLSNNRIEGTLPSSIGDMRRLQRLFLGGNNFEPGPLPSTWSNLVSLQELSLKGSELTGSLPDFLGDFSELVFLDLDNNRFDGTIPTVLGQLTNLEFLLLNRNRLIGVIPPEFAQLTKLRAVLLEGNYIMGQATALCGLPNFVDIEESGDLAVVVTDCQGSDETLTPVDCECCTLCCQAAPRLHGSDNEDGLMIEVTGSNSTEMQQDSPTGAPTQAPTVMKEHPSRATCHDLTLTANLNPRWELVYARDSYALGDRVWFNVENPRHT